MTSEQGALSPSLRILELGGGVASYTTHFLAALGADVVKVEPPSGDPDRDHPPFGGIHAKTGLSLHFLYFNANKRSVVLDLPDPEDRSRFLDLVRSSHVLVDSTAPTYLSGLGCSYEDLLADNPDLVILSQTPFGRWGPFHHFKGNNAIAEAMSGFSYPMGDNAHAPITSPNGFLSQVAGLHGAAYILAALRQVRQGGPGQYIDMSLQEVGTHMGTGLADYGIRHNIRRRPPMGYVVGAITILPVEDGYVITQPVTPSMWRSFVSWVGNDVLSGPEWETLEYRTRNQDVIEMLITPFAKSFSVQDFAREAQERRIPTGPVNPPEALLQSPQLAALGSLIDMSHPDIGAFQAMTYPFRMSKTPLSFRSPAPRLGEHQEEVLASSHRPLIDARPPAGGGPGSAPLEGIRVLDLTRVLAGPTATQLLGFLGAEVIKVETQSAEGGGRDAASGFVDLNRGKKSITVDARTPQGKELLLRLARECDVVVDNFSASVMDRLGLGYEDLRAVRPDIISVSINGWGRTGPIKQWSAYGPTLQSYTGLYWMWRHPDTPLEAGMKSPPADYLCGAEAALGILAALHQRDLTGQGQFVEVVMLEGIGHALGPFYLNAALNGTEQVPLGYASSRYAPYGVYPCLGHDAWCVVACETDAEWEGLKKAMGQPGWATDPQFATRDGRRQAHHELDERIASWTRQYTPRQVMHFLQAEGVAAGAMQDAEAVFHDHHLRARGHLVSPDHPRPWRKFEHQGMTAHFSSSTCRDDLPAATLGEHNIEIFNGLLGISLEEIKELQDARAIY